MRLINASTLRLEEFQNNTPPYAILSHTWGSSSDEVTFQDISGSGYEFQAKPGFRKITFCAKEALKDGLRYCWVDTCCIDKSSSSELSEAINSMYAWYANSEVCYIYLSDVDQTQVMTDVNVQFERSRWFTRGWTLQELISPKKRYFFDVNWLLIGKLLNTCYSSMPKRNGFYIGAVPGNDNGDQEGSLLKAISSITEIAEEVLETGDIQHYPACNKMSWAAKRHTTRVEDLAYCLMGIFGVNMPLLYGEGEKAFLRLQGEIMKTKVDHTIFLWHDDEPRMGSASSFCGLLSTSIRKFHPLKGMLPGGKSMSSYDMTNSGLRIQLPLIPNEKEPDEYQAILDVDYLGNPNLVFINLRRINSEGQFARVDVDESIQSVILRRKLPFESAQLTWVNCQNFFDRIPAIPSYRRLSRIIVKNNVPDEEMAIVNVEDDGTGFDFGTLSFPYSYGRYFEARILVDRASGPTSSRGRKGVVPTYFGWRIVINKWPSLVTQLTLLGQPSEIRREDLEWKPKVALKNYSSSDRNEKSQNFSEISSNPDFLIINGEMVVEISLRKQGVVLLNGRRRLRYDGNTSTPSFSAPTIEHRVLQRQRYHRVKWRQHEREVRRKRRTWGGR